LLAAAMFNTVRQAYDTEMLTCPGAAFSPKCWFWGEQMSASQERKAKAKAAKAAKSNDAGVKAKAKK